MKLDRVVSVTSFGIAVIELGGVCIGVCLSAVAVFVVYIKVCQYSGRIRGFVALVSA